MKKTLVDLFEESVRKYPDNTFLLEKTDKKEGGGGQRRGTVSFLC